jgi:diguanylate cyclase (GGDEF)-like protein/PAS domain S-box-containing protein
MDCSLFASLDWLTADTEETVTGTASAKGRHIKLALIGGFSVVLLLSAFNVWVGLSNMQAIQDRLNSIVENHNVKKDLVTTMRHAARDRTVSLYRMITLTDPFERDEEFMRFNRNGAAFAKARIELTAMPLNAREQAILDRQAAETSRTVELQRRVADLAMEDNLTGAGRLLYSDTVPGQDRVFVYLTELQNYQTEASRFAEEDARLKLVRARMVMFSSGAGALLLGTLIAGFVVRYTARAEARLFLEKKRAVVTLHSIGEGVIRTDARGRINYLNTVASNLTGWDTESAFGRDLLEIFRVVDDRGHALNDNPVRAVIQRDRIFNSDRHLSLKNPGGEEFGIEYTVAPIRDHDGTVIGAVLVFRNITEMRRMAHQMAYQATHDALTGLINRLEFESRLEAALESVRETGKRHTLFYMDLDQFKVVNDTCGHIAGDELLKQIAARLHARTRKTDTFARLGGDEFGLLLVNCALEAALHTAEALRSEIRDFRFVWENKCFEVSASIGVVELKSDSGTMTDVLSAADNACYVAKDLGRNRVHVFQPDDAALTQRRGEMQWLPRIRAALERDRFRLFFQRIVPVSPAVQEQHCEILLRLADVDGGLVPPEAFLPAAERYNLMPSIDRWVIQTAFAHLAGHPEYLADPLQLWTINLSGQTLCDPSLLEFVMAQFRNTGIPPGSICFEITETAAVHNLSRATELLSELRSMGCRFALDDFGSGLSSFNYLKHLKVDFLKIDGSFVKDMLEDSMDCAMVESINQIGQLMGLRTIAEFVERDAILQQLRSLRVDFAQGSAIHTPEPIDHWQGRGRISA